MASHQGKTQRKRISITLLILLLSFLIPIGIAWLLFAEHKTVGDGTTNHGHLISPPFSISLIPLDNKNGQRLNNRVSRQSAQLPRAKRTNGKWLLLLISPHQCNKACQTGLYNIRQIRLATGKNKDRIERGVLTYQHTQHNRLKQLLNKQYAGTRQLSVSQKRFENIIKRKVHTPYALNEGSLYIVDPLGNILMVYKPNTNPTAIFKDMQRLLKVSQIG